MDDVRLIKILNFLSNVSSEVYEKTRTVRKKSEDIFYISGTSCIDIGPGTQDEYTVELNLKDKTILLHGWYESGHNGDWYGHTEVNYPFSKLSHNWLVKLFKEKFLANLKIEEEKRLAEVREVAEEVLLNKKIEELFKE